MDQGKSPTSWLLVILAERRERRWCSNPSCTTCGGHEFRAAIRGVLAGLSRDSIKGLVYLNACEKVALSHALKVEQDSLLPEEFYFLRAFSSSYDRSLPSNKKRAAADDLISREAFEKTQRDRLERIANEKRLRKEVRDKAHAARLAKKKERDDLYWLSYWAARNAAFEVERRTELRYQRRTLLYRLQHFWKRLIGFIRKRKTSGKR
jgi:hypothetical protein